MREVDMAPAYLQPAEQVIYTLVARSVLWLRELSKLAQHVVRRSRSA